jgi:hypothetical protein
MSALISLQVIAGRFFDIVASVMAMNGVIATIEAIW